VIPKADRRQASRHEGEYRKCWCPSPGVILDVSPAGLSIETVKWMNPGEWIFVNTRMGGKKLGVPGEVRWIRQVASTRIGSQLSPVYHVGISVFREDVPPEWLHLVDECASAPAVVVEVGRAEPAIDKASSPVSEASTPYGSTD
jgi:hypothetical protein